MEKLKRYGETDSDAGIIHCSDGKYYLVEEVDPVIQELETQLKEKDCRIQELKLTISNANDRIKELEGLLNIIGDDKEKFIKQVILYGYASVAAIQKDELEELKRKAALYDEMSKNNNPNVGVWIENLRAEEK